MPPVNAITAVTADHSDATMVPAPTPAPTTPRYLNVGQIDTIKDALRTIHAIVWDMGTSGPLPTSFNKCDMSDVERLLKRTGFELGRVEERARQARLATVKGDVSKIVDGYQTAARAARKEYDSLSPTLRAMLPKLPNTVTVPVESLQGILGTSNAASIAKTMHELGYKIDGRTVANTKDCKAIVLPFVPEATESK